MERKRIAVGVIYDEDRKRVLLSKRPDTVHLGGLWEFPGGKLRSGEEVRAALNRELKEELDLTVIDAYPLLCVDHDYDELSVTLDVWVITKWQGEVCGREGQLIEWVSLAELRNRKFPAANKPVISAVKLPPVYLITPDSREYNKDFFYTLESLLDAGLRLLQFRSTNTGSKVNQEAIIKTNTLCKKYSCDLLVNSRLRGLSGVEECGLHLSSVELMKLEQVSTADDYWLAASCHNELEIKKACTLSVDFIVLSPVKATQSHPDQRPLGWDDFSTLAHDARIPTYALGGMVTEDLTNARIHGGQGISMISGIWDADEPAKTIKKILHS